MCARFEAGAASGALLLEWRVRFGGGLLVPLQGAASGCCCCSVCGRCKGCRVPLQGVAAGASINNMSTTAPPISTMSIKITSIGAVQQPSRLHPSGLCASTLRPSTLRASTPNPSRLCPSTLVHQSHVRQHYEHQNCIWQAYTAIKTTCINTASIDATSEKHGSVTTMALSPAPAQATSINTGQ